MSSDVSKLPQIKGLTSIFGKDVTHERLLADLNEMMLPLEMTFEKGLTSPQLPPIFILGPPRGGTTVTSQLLASTNLFGVITNFAARFWQAPALGLFLQKAIGICAEQVVSSFQSQRGLTEGWGEPNEYGYFWSRYFDIGQQSHHLAADDRQRVDVAGLQRSVAAMEKQAGRNMVFKNNTWFTLNADLLAQIFPRCVLVVCDRDPFYVAQSIWLQRNDLYNDPARWWSVKPADYSDIQSFDPLKQVAAQALSIRCGMRLSLREVRNAHVVEAQYQRLSAEPREVVLEICDKAGISEAVSRSAIEKLPSQLTSTDKVRVSRELEARLRNHIDELSPRYSDFT